MGTAVRDFILGFLLSFFKQLGISGALSVELTSKLALPGAHLAVIVL
jgi:hypothetical protein